MSSIVAIDEWESNAQQSLTVDSMHCDSLSAPQQPKKAINIVNAATTTKM